MPPSCSGSGKTSDEAIEWTTIASSQFENADGLIVRGGVPGLQWSFADKAATISGRTTRAGWSGTRLELPVDGDGELIEVSASIRIGKKNAKQLVVLRGHIEGGESGAIPMCLIYNEYDEHPGYYQIQARHIQVPNSLSDGRWWMSGTGEETERFHEMRMIWDREASEISYFADKGYIGTVNVQGPAGKMTDVQVAFETPHSDVDVDVTYRNLTVRRGVRTDLTRRP